MPQLTPSEAFIRTVRAARNRRGWNQQQLAERLTELGVPTAQSTVARLEKGKRGVSLDDALALSVALDVSLMHMVAGAAVDYDEIAFAPAVVLDTEQARENIRGNLSLHTGPGGMGNYGGFKGRSELQYVTIEPARETSAAQPLTVSKRRRKE